MKNKLQRMAPEWHAEAAELMVENFGAIHESFLDSTKKAVWLGLLFNFTKQRGKEDKSIPHGMFGPWLAKNVPSLNRDTVATYMRLAKNVAEKGEFQISDFANFAHAGDLPNPILKLIEGKTQQQLLFDYRQSKFDADGNEILSADGSRRGRRRGQGGASKEQRAAHAAAEEEARLAEIEITAGETAGWLMEKSDDKNLGLISGTANFKKLHKAVVTAAGYLNRFEKGGAKCS